MGSTRDTDPVLNSFDLSPFVTGHGVADDVRDAYFEAMREFFALPIEQKEAIAIGNSDCHRGYVGFETETLDGALAGSTASGPVAGDLKETLDTGIDHDPDHPEVLAGTPLHGSNQWPDLPGFRERVEPGEPMHHLRLIHYPPMTATAVCRCIEAIPTCVAAGETPRHEPMVTGPYLLSRFDGTHSYRNELLP